jgi:hypothetical protein
LVLGATVQQRILLADSLDKLVLILYLVQLLLLVAAAAPATLPQLEMVEVAVVVVRTEPPQAREFPVKVITGVMERHTLTPETLTAAAVAEVLAL